MIEEFEFNGYKATIILPENPNGKWIWKTEFLYAFDQAEKDLFAQGYTRVYYCISNQYGSTKAIRLMHRFHAYICEKYNLQKKAILFGFSRGGLYAFNYALYYPEYVEKVYLDAPVLDLKTWPPRGSKEQAEMFKEYCLNEDTLTLYDQNPIDCIKEFFALNIPLLLIAGDADEVVSYPDNAKKVIDYCRKNNLPLKYFIKHGGKHHPHSLKNTKVIIDFLER